MDKTASLEFKDQIAIITLKRTEALNAINERMIEVLTFYFDKIQSDKNIDVLIITGSGRSFCAGADTKDLLSKEAEEGQQALEAILDFLQDLGKIKIPVIAAINGFAFGGGAQLALACDIRIASESSSFRFPGASYGLVISGHILPSIVGVPKAKELLFSSKVLSAKEALDINLVNQVTPDGKELEQAIELAEEICQNPAIVVREIKACIDDGIGETQAEKLAIENKINNKLIKSGEYRKTFATFVSNLRSRTK